MKHPYIDLPDYQFWKKEKAITQPELFDPVIAAPFKIKKKEAIVTAGSCFAQHVARYLNNSGFNHYISEPAHPMFSADIAKQCNYGTFSARYGNIYTARQLKQLLQRAYGLFEPKNQTWQGKGNSVVDPFRPQIQPGGFISEKELEIDRKHHLASVRKSIENMSVFVFTLGLTECWIDKEDGSVYPLAPGVAGGKYDPKKTNYHNFSLEETVADLLFSLNFIREKNPKVKFILTVSPVPLNATKEDRHVFVSTTWSKAVLRLAAEEAVNKLDQCCYFPSYEIITSPYSRGSYFEADCRSVKNEGVEHVMGLFLKHFGNIDSTPVPNKESKTVSEAEVHLQAMKKNIDILCDEEAINNK